MNDPSSHAECLRALYRLQERLEALAEEQQGQVTALWGEMEELKQQLMTSPTPQVESLLPEMSPELEEFPIATETPREEPVEAFPSKPLLGETSGGTPEYVPPPPLPARERMPEPTPSPRVAAPPKASLEQQLGRVWLVRIGIVLLLTGLVLGANWAYKNWIHNLAPGIRLMGLYLCSLLIGGSGYRLTKKSGYQRYGEVLVAGGLAFFYYCTYAAHHVSRLRVIESPVTAAVLLLGAAGVIAAISWFRQSRAIAVMGILLASYATLVQPLDWLSATSNLVLALAGITLMLRPGWGAPGIAALLGTYAAFGGWQILGAAGHSDSRAALWFLPGSWAIFAIPGTFGRFRSSLGERGRMFFTAANNGLFFLCFSAIWLARFGSHEFWQIPAVFGLVLLVLGAMGRRHDDAAAASNVGQALALMSLALVLKLEGHHLVLALSAESLTLALAFHRFRKRAEFAFSLLAGMGAAVLTPFLGLSSFPPISAWSGGFAAVCVAAAAVIFRYNVSRAGNPPPAQVRQGTSLLAFSALGILVFGCVTRLPETWKLPATAGFSAAFGLISLLGDRKRWMPEVAWASGSLGLIAIPLLTKAPETSIGMILSVLAGLAGCWVWHRPVPMKGGPLIAIDPAEAPQGFAWLQSLFVPLACLKLVDLGHFSGNTNLITLAASSAGLVAIAKGLKAVRLEISGQLLNLLALLTVISSLDGKPVALSTLGAFSPALAAAAAFAIVNFPRRSETRPCKRIARGLFFFGWIAALYHAAPRGFSDLMALSAAASFAWAWKKRIIASVETWGWLIVSFSAYFLTLISGPDSKFHGHEFEGIALVAVVAGIALMTPGVPPKWQRFTAKTLPWLACALFTVWSTHIVVARYDWKAVAVLWTICGFGLVTLGLVLSRITSRQVGFLLLGLALLKLFAVDVWDFTTFMRVVSFLALGLALVLLGLFYHRFAPAMKRMLEDGSPEE
jgi:uncharacterized membrane protein